MKAYCLLNHELTENQEKELSSKYNCTKIIYPAEELKAAWSQIPAVDRIDRNVIRSVTDWLDGAEKGDVLIIQGEFGSTFMIVDYALRKELIPLHAVTKRVATEKRDGEKVQRQYIFEHVCFRPYEYYD
ncbi:MAG: hypothetical protein K5930_01265 [Treponemataceae bacterium]|nr:hypothetical protein [Treponemataceae bacterium]